MMLRRRMISRDKVRGTLPIILGNMTRSSSVSPSKQCSPLSESSKYCHQRHLTVNREITVGLILVCFIAGLDMAVPGYHSPPCHHYLAGLVPSIELTCYFLLYSLLTTGKDNIGFPLLTFHDRKKKKRKKFYLDVQTALFMNLSSNNS